MNVVGKTRCISAFLENKWGSVRAAQFPPPNAGDLCCWTIAGGDRLIRDNRLEPTEITIGSAVQRSLAIAQVVDFVCRSRLRNTSTGAAAKRQYRIERH